MFSKSPLSFFEGEIAKICVKGFKASLVDDSPCFRKPMALKTLVKAALIDLFQVKKQSR